ncbi:hypothetical protein [Paraburkholderia tuberum]|uniref:Uncharacterized protein n=1 Tax=Paraburkholderia tuberum TaxID=157910 RepID=A0A1H1JMX2_9BURK|nr:hypothetical protein [Paraburkholderia tuberum]SDR51039.1 hypothetical protein SAMN05445850_5184 [Paraburkholderia tuberum]
MNSQRLSMLSATAIALLSLNGAAHAGSACSASLLNGAYGFSAVGQVIGLIDSAGVHQFVTQLALNDVSLVTFDGSKHFTRIDVGTTNGAPKNGVTSFTGAQSGAYTVNPDCTGTMTIKYDSGVVLGLEIVVTDDARLIKAIIISETVPSVGPTVDAVNCTTTSCSEAVQVSLEGRKVEAFGFRH